MNFASFCPINEKGLDADLLAVVTLAKLDIMRGIRMISAAVDPSNILLFQDMAGHATSMSKKFFLVSFGRFPTR